MKKKILAACAMSLLMSLTACNDKMDPNDPQSVRKYLTKQKVGLTPNNFVSYAANGDTAMMTLFLQASFEIDTPADNGNNAVAIAANKGNVSVLKYLFAHGAKADVRNGNGEAVIENAVTIGNKEVVTCLLAQLKAEGYDPNGLNTAVLLAAKSGKVDMLELLVEAGASLENRSPDGYLPIHWTVKNGQYDAMMYLIGKGVDVNAKCGQGYSVLDWATNEGYTRLIKALKKAGAKNTPQYFKDSKK
ncbi:MAG: ankyrin repeat domain-containing protein [Fibrobacter sp.]|nr:ankyrin repeat domain-containing protein [Fibrobacter sp.]